MVWVKFHDFFDVKNKLIKVDFFLFVISVFSHYPNDLNMQDILYILYILYTCSSKIHCRELYTSFWPIKWSVNRGSVVACLINDRSLWSFTAALFNFFCDLTSTYPRQLFFK